MLPPTFLDRWVDLTAKDWDQVLSMNLRAPFLLAKAAFPHLQRAGAAGP
ncbi:hypothetical protein [Deinococcus budaensis]|uniref:NAD(P)-dependent dehydrogenase (Short-subunit alcohol dehydrogenase family) n=1 Tax=Deinococcus budaensis TaxID=1665626 RepID=A0A7W8GEK4_9DEIO|nr:hypothetical protein [Deinococcus budaensis]MBB5234115.1 NAD(P)-dependent dehydrogenase (short-subunit alcohol dehydrogenase family) [Deinococcus budaensis]